MILKHGINFARVLFNIYLKYARLALSCFFFSERNIEYFEKDYIVN